MNTKFIDQIPGNIAGAWRFSFERLYCEKTKLFYDRLTEDTPDGAISHLPTPEMIARQVPNPCGWGTGMEDCAINGGVMIDAVLTLYQKTGNLELVPILHEMMEGYLSLVTVSSQEGFLARGISPVDGRSHYINSSRDQYTHWVDAALLFYESGLATREEKAAIVKALEGFARKAEREIYGDHFEYLREDGQIGAVCKMRGEIDAHEYLRLPMIYLAAYRASGDSHWLDKYLEYREEAFVGSEQLYEDGYMNRFTYAYALLQMQYSLRLIYREDPDTDYRQRAQKLMEFVAEYSHRYTYDGLEEVNAPHTELAVGDWRDMRARLAEFTSGYGYYIPVMPGGTRVVHMRNAAEAIIMQCLCHGSAITVEQKEMFDYMVENTDFSAARCYWTNLFCTAWVMLL